jgi:uncharacterized protein YciI
MPLFVISFLDKPDSLPLRVANRDDHLAYMAASGIIKLGGPYLNDKGDPIGSLVIVEAQDEAQVRAFMKDEPYNKAGLIPHFDVRPWRYTAGQLP